jgi:hypothetical protein
LSCGHKERKNEDKSMIVPLLLGAQRLGGKQRNMARENPADAVTLNSKCKFYQTLAEFELSNLFDVSRVS